MSQIPVAQAPPARLPAPPGVVIFGRRIFYGWWTVAAGIVLGSLAAGVYTHGFTAFVLPLTEEFGVGTGTIGLAFALAGLFEAFVGPVQGILIDRYGPRRISLFGITLLSIGFILISTAQSIVVFMVFFVVVLSPGMSMGFFHTPSAAVSNWFVRRRGVALALTMVGFGLGGVLVPLVQLLIDAFGWRTAAVALAFIILGIGYPAAMVLRHRPESYGQYPDGSLEPPKTLEEGGLTTGTEINFRVKEALQTRSFWLLSASFSLRMIVVASLSVHFIPIMEDKGFSPATGAALLSLFAAVTIPTRLILVFFIDRMPKNTLAGGMLGLQALSMVVLAWSTELWQIYVFLILYAIAWGGSGANLITAIRGEYFGRRYFATIGGSMSFVMIVGTAGGPTFTGFSFDWTDSYDIAFYTFIAASVLSSALMFLAKRPVPRGLRHVAPTRP